MWATWAAPNTRKGRITGQGKFRDGDSTWVKRRDCGVQAYGQSAPTQLEQETVTHFAHTHTHKHHHRLAGGARLFRLGLGRPRLAVSVHRELGEQNEQREHVRGARPQRHALVIRQDALRHKAGVEREEAADDELHQLREAQRRQTR